MLFVSLVVSFIEDFKEDFNGKKEILKASHTKEKIITLFKSSICCASSMRSLAAHRISLIFYFNGKNN